MIKAIETLYKGYRFRSRTEARWAVFFDALEYVTWEYEKAGYVLEDGTCYMPDFWIQTLPDYEGSGCFVEIKGVEPTGEERKKLELLAKGTGNDVLCFWGQPRLHWDCCAYYHHYTSLNVSKLEKGFFEHSANAMLGDPVSDKNGHPSYRLYFMKFGYYFERLPKSHIEGKIKEAINKARGARFEFGEQG